MKPVTIKEENLVSESYQQSHNIELSRDTGQNLSTRYSNQSVEIGDEIDLVELIRLLWRGKRLIIGLTSACAVIAVIYALLLPNIYRSEALIAPTSGEEGGLKGMLGGQLGGLASIAGVNLSGGGSEATKALAILESRQFLAKFIERHNILVPLMATTWRPLARELEIDNTIYDEVSERWVREVQEGRSPKPTNLEAVDAFRERFSVSQDKKTELVTVAFEWYRPEQAAQWVNALVQDINAELRKHDRVEAQRAIAYLREQLEKTHLVDMQQVFYQLIESQMKTVMLTDARADYAFQVIDPAVVPEKKSEPKRAIIAIVSTMAGGLFGVFLVLLRTFLPKNQ